MGDNENVQAYERLRTQQANTGVLITDLNRQYDDCSAREKRTRVDQFNLTLEELWETFRENNQTLVDLAALEPGVPGRSYFTTHQYDVTENLIFSP